MILNQQGDVFEYNGISYKIGDEIYVTYRNKYEGLFGVILEIRDGKDKDTGNKTPDIYCRLKQPVLPHDVEALEARFSALYGEPKTLDDISLDEIIMAPEMISIVTEPSDQSRKITIYLIDEDWAVDDEYGHSIIPCIDYNTAKWMLGKKLEEEKKTGCISQWEEDEDLMFDSGNDFYECWLDGRYSENHSKVKIEVITLPMSDQDWGTIGRRYLDESRVEDFISQTNKIRETESLTDAQYQRLIKDPSIPERIHSRLGKNDRYWECYWDAITDVAHDLIRVYKETVLQRECFTPEENNPYPLCTGNGQERCKRCCLYAEMENEGGYNV